MSIVSLFREEFQIKEQIFHDFKAKASILVESSPAIWPSLRARHGLRHWAKFSYAAYQVFMCFLHGFGTSQNLFSAGKYLAASSRGGYVNAISTSIQFSRRYPDIEMPHWTPHTEALFHIVKLGPWPGLSFFLLDMQLLAQLAPAKLQEALELVKASAFSELGDDHKSRKEYDEESFVGPDVRYQWFASGSMSLFQRLLSQCSPSDLINGFERGLFPVNGKSSNDETVLYICCRTGDAEKVLSLLQMFDWARKQVDVATCDGRAPLHCLYLFTPDHVKEVAQTLLSYGADINAADTSGCRAIDYAIEAGRDDIAALLLDYREFLAKHSSCPHLALTLVSV